MPDRLLFPLMGLVAVLMIALALIWPQGLGARSPGPFGHTPVQQTAGAREAKARASAPPPVLSIAPTGPSSAPTSGPGAAP
jgi:hypothetical protein